jgi:hypothetical protein
MIRAITYGCPSPVKCLTLADAITHRPWLPPIVRKKARSLGGWHSQSDSLPAHPLCVRAKGSTLC